MCNVLGLYLAQPLCSAQGLSWNGKRITKCCYVVNNKARVFVYTRRTYVSTFVGRIWYELRYSSLLRFAYVYVPCMGAIKTYHVLLQVLEAIKEWLIIYPYDYV